MSRKFYWFIGIVFISLCTTIFIAIQFFKNDSNNMLYDNNDINQNVEVINKEEQLLELEEMEDIGDKSIDVEVKTTTDNTQKNVDNNSSTSKKNTSSNNISSNANIVKNNVNSDNTVKEVESKEEKTNSSNNDTIKEIEQVEITKPTEEKNVEKTYIGVPNPNDFYYSIHKGVIDYKVSNYPNQDIMKVCLDNAIRISFKDTVDILNTNCIDVMDGTGTILGEYLQINCKSGNCNRYKD